MKWALLSGWTYSTGIFEKLKLEESISLPWERHIDDLDSLSEALPRDPICVLAWSLGAFVALPFLAHDRVKGAVLIATGLSFCRSEINPYGAESLDMEAMRRSFDRSPESTIKAFRRKCGADKNQKTEMNTEILGKGLAYLARVKTTPFSFKKPLTLIHGKRDTILSFKSALTMAKHIPARLILCDAGHNVIQTHRERVKEEIRRMEALL